MKQIVFATSRAIREYIKLKEHKNQLLPKLITIGELFRKVLFLKEKKFIDDILRVVYLKDAICVENYRTLGISSSLSELFTQGDYILNFLSELSNEFVSIDDIDKKDIYALYDEHLAVLKQISQNYLDILEKNGYVDKINLPQNYELNKQYIKRFDSFEFRIEGFLTKFEFKLLHDISKITNTTILFDYNKFNTNIAKHLDSFDLKLYHSYEINLTQNKIKHIKKQKNIIKTIDIKPFASKIDEIAYIKYAIYKMINIDSIDPQNIVVVLPDESMATYMRLFDENHNFNYAFGFDIKNSKLYQTIDRLISLDSINKTKHKDRVDFLDIDKDLISFIKKDINKNIDKTMFEKFVQFVTDIQMSKEIKEHIDSIFYNFKNIFIDKNIKIKLKDILNIFFKKLSKISIDDTTGGKVTVLGVLECRGVEFEGVIICNFNDNIVPKQSIKDKFINSKIKTQCNLPTTKDREELQGYFYDKLIRCANKVHISFIKDDENDISRFAKLLQLQYKDKTIDKNYKDILYKEKKYEINKEKIIIDIDISKKIWSATSLESYLTCKRQYLYKYIYNIKEHDDKIKPKKNEIGIFMHQVLFECYKDKKTYDDKDELYQKIISLLQMQNSANIYLVFDISLWKKRLKKFVQNEIERFEAGYRVKHIEHSVDMTYKNIKINGKIDRVDTTPDGLYDIIDYKTSKQIKIDNEKNVDTTNKFQLQFYHILLQSNGIKDGYFYHLFDGKLIKEDMMKQKLERLNSIFDSLKTTKVDFAMTQSISDCSYCAYKTICQRD